MPVQYVTGSLEHRRKTSFVFFSYGRKMGRPIHVITGLVLMVYPYFIPTVWVMLLIGALLCALNYLAVQRGI
jgi:hypothetical protein